MLEPSSQSSANLAIVLRPGLDAYNQIVEGIGDVGTLEHAAGHAILTLILLKVFVLLKAASNYCTVLESGYKVLAAGGLLVYEHCRGLCEGKHVVDGLIATFRPPDGELRRRDGEAVVCQLADDHLVKARVLAVL